MTLEEKVRPYLDMGWYIFPIQPGGKAPLTPNGFKDASNSVEQIIEWAQRWKDCNWAVAPAASDLIIVDLDTYKDAGVSDNFLARVGVLPKTREARSANGGTHLYFIGPQVPSRNGIIKGVDVRSSNGYVLLPPSVVNGKPYEWVYEETAKAPERLIDFLQQTPSRDVLKETDSEELFLGAGDGRWEHLRIFAGRLRAWGWSQSSIEGALLVFADEQCEPDPSISKSKVRDLAKWICTKPTENTKDNPDTLPAMEMVRIEMQGKTYKIPSGQLSKALMKGAKLL